MVYEITRDLPLKPIEIETPICQYTGYELAKKCGDCANFTCGTWHGKWNSRLIPTAKIAHVGMYRDEETLEPHTYFEKLSKELRRCDHNRCGSNARNWWFKCSSNRYG